jgi:hypothetical protein
MANVHADRVDTPYNVTDCGSACALTAPPHSAPARAQYSATYCALYCSSWGVRRPELSLLMDGLHPSSPWELAWTARRLSSFVLSSFVFNNVFRHDKVTL